MAGAAIIDDFQRDNMVAEIEIGSVEFYGAVYIRLATVQSPDPATNFTVGIAGAAAVKLRVLALWNFDSPGRDSGYGRLV
jgi:hypothetical protein